MIVRRYQVSVALLVATMLIVSIAIGGAAYFWTSKTVPLSVEEPLVLTNFPSMISTHPGQNQTIDVTITNSANINYTVTLYFTLNDTAYAQSYAEFSNNTYTISAGLNQIQGWLSVDRKAPPANLALTIEFYRE